jgi:prefoldin subunit 5
MATVYVTEDSAVPEILRRLDAIDRNIKSLKKTITQGDSDIMADLSRLTQEVAETTEVAQSAITFIAGLSEQIRELSTDPAALEALADELDATQANIAAAIAPDAEPEA